MAGQVVWWVDPSDGAAHALLEAHIGQGRALLTTLCQRTLYAHEVQRNDQGPKCMACRLLAESRQDARRRAAADFAASPEK